MATQESQTVISQEGFLDIRGAQVDVDVHIRDDGKVLWVSVDGITVLRICQIRLLKLRDYRD